MNEEEKKAIEILQGLCTDDCINNDVVQTVVNLIEKQQKEIEEKEKVIDEMAKELVNLPIPISQEENVLFFNSFDVKKFFYKKIEKK
jgi:hypothetical protein